MRPIDDVQTGPGRIRPRTGTAGPARAAAAAVTAAILVGLALVAPAGVLHAGTIHVPADSTTIQGAIRGATTGDTVLVAPGTYFESSIDFLGKGIVVTGTDPADSAMVAATVVQGDSTSSVFLFRTGEGGGSVLSGMTLTGGGGLRGGGVLCDGASPVISDNIITANYVGSAGGGIVCRNGARPSILRNTIHQNSAAGFGGGIECETGADPTIGENRIADNLAAWGGGIACTSQSHPVIVDNAVKQNEASTAGGGIYIHHDSHPIVTGNSVTGNSTTGFFNGGGGIAVADSSGPIIAGNTISGNAAVGDPLGGATGGGIEVVGGSFPEIRGNVIRGNSAGNDGGGISVEESSAPWIVDNTISENTAGDGGGGIRNGGTSAAVIEGNLLADNGADIGGGIRCEPSSTPVLWNNTLSGNSAATGGGGLSCGASVSGLSGLILWGNSAPQGPELRVEGGGAPDTLTIDFSDVRGGPDSVALDSLTTLVWGGGMLELDPLFVEPDSGDFHLQAGSPCIDRGDDTRFDGCLPPGLGGGRSDMGAYGGEENCGWLEPGIDLILSPRGPETAARGSTLPFRAFVRNHSVDAILGDMWFTARLPDGREVLVPASFLNYPNPLSGQIAGSGYVALYPELGVPPGAPLGSYTLIGRAGLYTNTVMDEESFDFTVTP
jgi:parallel beta-helix repeat protein